MFKSFLSFILQDVAKMLLSKVRLNVAMLLICDSIKFIWSHLYPIIDSAHFLSVFFFFWYFLFFLYVKH